jgi:hypothetical protein
VFVGFVVRVLYYDFNFREKEEMNEKNMKLTIAQYGVGNREMIRLKTGHWLKKSDVVEWLNYIQDDDTETADRVRQFHAELFTLEEKIK